MAERTYIYDVCKRVNAYEIYCTETTIYFHPLELPQIHEGGGTVLCGSGYKSSGNIKRNCGRGLEQT